MVALQEIIDFPIVAAAHEDNLPSEPLLEVFLPSTEKIYLVIQEHRRRANTQR
ncbi:MAG: hypothetical protein WD823_00550 [Sulfuricaulis sp.]|uniref:hypothetical protein n=1 Tax=Sulfuricaulis sp. TaxID=2003553 RepID=UPI0034A4E6CB